MTRWVTRIYCRAAYLGNRRPFPLHLVNSAPTPHEPPYNEYLLSLVIKSESNTGKCTRQRTCIYVHFTKYARTYTCTQLYVIMKKMGEEKKQAISSILVTKLHFVKAYYNYIRVMDQCSTWYRWDIVGIPLYHTLQVVHVHPLGSHCTARYRWDTVGIPSVPCGTDGTARLSVPALCDTSLGIPLYHMVQMGRDGQVEQPDSLCLLCDGSLGIPLYHMVQMGRDGQVGQPDSLCLHCVVHPLGSHLYHMVQMIWYRWMWYRWDISWDSTVPHGTDWTPLGSHLY